MVKLMVTGDNHIGRKFERYEFKAKLVESRLECLRDVVRAAERERCEFLVVTGDLFDNNYTIPKKTIKEVIEILAAFDQRVLILPGNHDYYSENEQFWKDFKDIADNYHNIFILNEYKPYEFEGADGQIAFYPAYCDSKHSETNRLGWIKEYDIPVENQYNVGVAHGALEGLAIDTEGMYFPMSEMELRGIPMDAWLIGHAHVTYPNIALDEEASNHSIFNAGTHEQLDLHNNTEGNVFVISLQNNDGLKKVTAKRLPVGRIRYFDEDIELKSTDTRTLKDAIEDAVNGYPENSVVRHHIKGSIDAEEYQDRYAIYEEVRNRFLDYIVIDDELSEKITKESIEKEFSEVGFTAAFLKELLDDPVELQMAIDIVKSLK